MRSSKESNNYTADQSFLFAEMAPDYFENGSATPLSYELLTKVLAAIKAGTDVPKEGAITFEKQSNRFRRWGYNKENPGRQLEKLPLSREEDLEIEKLFAEAYKKRQEEKNKTYVSYDEYLKTKKIENKEEEEEWDRKDKRGGPF